MLAYFYWHNILLYRTPKPISCSASGVYTYAYIQRTVRCWQVAYDLRAHYKLQRCFWARFSAHRAVCFQFEIVAASERCIGRVQRSRREDRVFSCAAHILLTTSDSLSSVPSYGRGQLYSLKAGGFFASRAYFLGRVAMQRPSNWYSVDGTNYKADRVQRSRISYMTCWLRTFTV